MLGETCRLLGRSVNWVVGEDDDCKGWVVVCCVFALLFAKCINCYG